MKSMTGFGRAVAALGTDTLTVQVSSVNRKTLDLTIGLPDEWEALEAPVGELVRQYASRGKIHVRFEVTGASGPAVADWDEATVAAQLAKLSDFASKQGITFAPTAELLWQIASAQRKGAALPPVDEVKAIVLATTEEALRAFSAMRAEEGAALLADFEARLATLRTHVATISERAPQVAPTYRELLLKRLRDAGLEINADDERVLKEIALFADRSDVTEELTRLRSHLDQFATLLRAEGEIGRKAEFILQEIGREVNTTGAKANDLTIARSVIELKNELERIREQIANVE
jgi:TIGR00255 family protein